MQIKGIFFDLGGTLFSYNYGPQKSSTQAAASKPSASKPSRRGMGSGLGFVLGKLGIEAEPADIGTAWGEANRHVGQRYGREQYFLHRELFRDTKS